MPTKTIDERWEMANILGVALTMLVSTDEGIYIPKYATEYYAEKRTLQDFKERFRDHSLIDKSESEAAAGVNLLTLLNDLEGLKGFYALRCQGFISKSFREQELLLHVGLTLIPNFYELTRKLKAA